jgi:hypothetical protein
MSARDQVLALPELLELILLEVPMRDLLLVQRECKTWQNAAQSKLIQRKLFFQPMGLEEVLLRLESIEDDSEDHRTQYKWTRPGLHLHSKPIRIYRNPVFWGLASKMAKTSQSFYETLSLLPEPWQRPEASWRAMLITQPSFITEKVSIGGYQACPELECRWDTDSRPRRSTGDSGFPQRLGEIFDSTLESFQYVWGSCVDIFQDNGCEPSLPKGIYVAMAGWDLMEGLPDEGWAHNSRKVENTVRP